MDLTTDSRRVWVNNHPVLGYAPGRVEEALDDGTLLVVDDEGSQFKLDAKTVESVDPACLQGVDDLLQLGDFNEAALLHNIRVRYEEQKIYTSVGTPILISINPYQTLAGLYDPATQKQYRHAGAARASGQTVTLMPHLYSVADSAYRTVLNERANQSIIISGESGAGKTEATKRILAYLAEMQRATRSSSGQTSERTVEDQVLDANPVLEAFGNAKTVRNDNSSRFGKFIEVEFDGTGRLVGAQIQNYLLEKCRIVTQQPEERNYHVFYQLCAGVSSVPELADKLKLADTSDYDYVSVCENIDGVDDAKEFAEMVQCMASLGFTTEEREAAFRIVAAVLNLGNLEFTVVPREGQDGVGIADTDRAQLICDLLGVELDQLRTVLEHKTLEDPLTKKVIMQPHTMTSATFSRHAIAKVSYARLFDWLVWRINQGIVVQQKTKKDLQHIGLLDIFGFEVFEWNSFEQLCINFANEKLQQHFNTHMFTQEQQLYTKEGITWNHIVWQDNSQIIETLEKKPLGLFCLADSECTMPSATDATLLGKIYNTYKNSKIVFKPSRFATMDFAVAHYAGDVIYNVETFLEKNTDKLHSDIVNLLKGSKLDLVKLLFTDPKFSPEAKTDSGPDKKRAPLKRGSTQDLEKRSRQNVTVSMMFREQLDKLVEDLNKTNPRFVRCIKPNANKSPTEFDSVDVLRQLRCAGMLEAIRIRRAGYGVRRPFKDFFERFRLLAVHLVASGANPDYRGLCQKLVTAIEQRVQKEGLALEEKSWQVGQSRLFMKDELEKHCERLLADFMKSSCVRIQKVYRGWMSRKRYQNTRRLALAVQSAGRTLLALLEYREPKRRHDAAVELQAALRGYGPRLDFTRQRRAAICVQRRYRGWRCRSKIGAIRSKKAAEKIRKLREEQERAEAQQKSREEQEQRLQEEQQRSKEREQEIEAAKLEKERENEQLRRELEAAKAAKDEEKERENEQLRRELQEAKEAKAVDQQKLEDAQFNQTLEMESQLLSARHKAAEHDQGEKDALLEKVAQLERANQDLMQSKQDVERRADELDKTLKDVKTNQSARGPDRLANTASNALESLQMELKSRLNIGAGAGADGPPRHQHHPLGSALVSTLPGVPSADMLSMSQRPDMLSQSARDGPNLHEEGRRTLMNQRAMFEKLKMQFSEVEEKEANAPSAGPFENLDDKNERLQHLENEVRRLTQENARLKTSALQFQEEAAEHLQEVEDLVDGNGRLQAELQELRYSRHKDDADLREKLEQAVGTLQHQTEDMAKLIEQKREAEALIARLQADGVEFDGDRRVYQEQMFQLERSYKDATEELNALRQDHTELRHNLDASTRSGDAAARAESASRLEVDRLTKELRAKDNELANVKRLLDEVMGSHVPVEELQKWRAKAEKLEQQYQVAVRYNKEMTSAVGHMTQAASERGGDLSDVQQMNAQLQKEHERKDQELKMMELEKQDMQKQLDNVQSSCTYFQSKYKTTSSETKRLQQETAAASEKASVLAQTAAISQREIEQLRGQVTALRRQLAEAHHCQPSISSASSATGQARLSQVSELEPELEPRAVSSQGSGREREAAGLGDAAVQQMLQQQDSRQQQQQQLHQQQLQQQLLQQQYQQQRLQQHKESSGTYQGREQQEHISGRPSLLTQLNVSRRNSGAGY